MLSISSMIMLFGGSAEKEDIVSHRRNDFKSQDDIDVSPIILFSEFRKRIDLFASMRNFSSSGRNRWVEKKGEGEER